MPFRAPLLGVFVATLGFAGGPASAARLETGNGLALDFSPAGQVTRLAIRGARLPLVSPGGLAVADFADQPKPVNLVPNPGFEEGTAGWRLDRWQTLDTQMAHGGRASVRLTVPPGEPRSTTLEVRVPVKPNTRYRVGLWLRRQAVGVCGAYSSERDERNRLTGKQGQVGAGIPKQDGVWLPVSWEITTEPATTRLSLRADIYRSTGTLWLDDYSVEEISPGVYDPVEGRTESVADGLRLRASLAKRNLEVEAVFRPGPECVRVEGEVRDTTGRDRAVGVRFALPLDLAGWNWYNDAEERLPIEAGRKYAHTYNCRTGSGRCSIYPWAAVTGRDAGLSLALPLAQGPRVFVLEHDQSRPQTALTFYFGLAADAGHHPRRAKFSFVLYPHDPAWGMRSAMQLYYRLFAESFVKRPTFEGYLNYADIERFEPKRHGLVIYQRDTLDDASDFGEGYKFLWHLHGCYDFRQVAYEDSKLPADAKVFALLAGMVAAEQNRPKWYTPTAETLRKIVFDHEQHISYISDTRYWRAQEGYNHTDKPGWGFNFRVNEDPEVSPFLAELARKKAEQYARQPGNRPWDATFTADAIEGYFANSHGPDYRREHFRTTLVPLTFGYGNLRPCMPNTIWDFHHKAWRPITDQYKITVYGNANGYEQFFTMPYVDVPMTEGLWDARHPSRIDCFMRAVNYRKIWRHWHAWDEVGRYANRDPARVQAHFRSALAYAVYPAVGCVQQATGDLEPHRALYRQYVPAIEELSTAGWDPVPYATASGGVVVERYGTFAAGELHLTLRNYTDRPISTQLTLDRKSLGIPADAELVVIDILPRTPRGTPFVPQVELDADGSRALWIGTRRQAAQHGFRLARATLEKLERLFAGELHGASRATVDAALDKARAGTSIDAGPALRTAEELQQLATRLQTELATAAPVDLAKLLFRLRADVSLVPAALLRIDTQAPRVVADAVRGQTVSVSWNLRRDGRSLADVQTRAAVPWADVVQRSRVQPAADNARRFAAELWVPAKPERRLMPYLLEARTQVDGQPCTVVAPVDVQVAPPLEVTLSPERVLRGQEVTLSLTLVNRCPAPARLAIDFRLPPKVRLAPARLNVELAGHAKGVCKLRMTLDRNVPIGDLRVNYAVSSSDAQFALAGPLFLVVEDAGH
jgi:hypothetical protein